MTDQSAEMRQRPSPHSYSSPSMQSAYRYPPPHPQPLSSDIYRASPSASSMPPANLSLPPIRAIDGQQQPAPPQQTQSPASPPPPLEQQQQNQQHQSTPPSLSQQQQQSQQQNQSQPHQRPSGSPLTAPSPSAGSSFYGHPGQTLPSPHQLNTNSSPQHVGMRYQIPPQATDQRIMSGGRHKKEIKRRTKTGCLTCRKRRIKCDEAHPTCRNCQKSKRDCLGYDPIFKQQPGSSQAQPPHIQPAPSGASPVPSIAASAPIAVEYHTVPQGYTPATAGGYPGATPTNAKTESNAAFEFTPAIDPVLAAADATTMPAAQISENGTQQAVQTGSQQQQHTNATMGVQSLRGKPVRIEDLFSISGIPPLPVPLHTSPLSPETLEEIKILYTREYAPALDGFLETQWYSSKSFHVLENNEYMIEMLAYLLKQFKEVRSENAEAMKNLPSLEAKAVWHMMCLARNAPEAVTNGVNGNSALNTEVSEKHFLAEANARLNIFESLITGQPLGSNPALAMHYPESIQDTAKLYEIEFWQNLGSFAASNPKKQRKDDTTANQADIALASMRNVLAQLENRDVIYSIAVVQHYGDKVDATMPIANGVSTVGLGDQDTRDKIMVARRFLQDEANRGMSQVITRVAGMAIQSWPPL